MKKVITMTLCNRPQYTKRVLESLSRCIGIEKYLLLPFIEPGNDEVIGLVRGISFCECKMSINSKKMGCATNTFLALQKGFQSADFVTHVEDDVCLAPDALHYMEFCAERFKNVRDVYTVCLYQRGPCSESNLHTISKRSYFVPWGWGTWKNRWQEPNGMSGNWDLNESRGGWDVHINKVLRKSRNEVYPILARAINIGAEGGVHTPSSEWHKQNVHSDIWAGSPVFNGKILQNTHRWVSGQIIIQ